MIPKRVSFFWGNPKMSWLRYMTLKSFRQFHPDWEMFFYVNQTDKDFGNPDWVTNHRQDFFNYEGYNYIHEVRELGVQIIQWEDENCRGVSPSQKSNFFKWRLLAKEGGFYSDMDVLYFNPIDSIREKMNDGEYDIGITHNSHYYSIGFMASGGNNKVFQAIYDNCVNIFDDRHYQGAGVQSIYQRWKKENCPEVMEREFPENKFYYIPMDEFYYLNRLPRIYQQDWTKKLFEIGTALHWYAGGELAQNYNNFVDSKNFRCRDNTISRVLQHILI